MFVPVVIRRNENADVEPMFLKRKKCCKYPQEVIEYL